MFDILTTHFMDATSNLVAGGIVSDLWQKILSWLDTNAKIAYGAIALVTIASAGFAMGMKHDWKKGAKWIVGGMIAVALLALALAGAHNGASDMSSVF